uniref:Chitin-binding type-2 domain-containing protein n=1 Tax=Setaria digitata TaxID=48799 RepID=A0A915Q2P1_9BILA
MSATVFFIFFATVNAQCERSFQANENEGWNQYHSQNLQSSQQSRNDIMVQRKQQPFDHHDRTTTECSRGDLVSNDRDCSTYYECVNGRYELRLCPSNAFFNPTLKCCHADYVCPNQLSTTPSLLCKYGELRADETSCMNYYFCTGDERRFERRSCPTGKVFDRRLNQCVPSAGQRCQHSAEAFNFQARSTVGLACTESGGPLGYSVDPTDCRHYYQCAQGRWVRMQCPSNLVWNPAATVCDWPENTLLSCQ